MSQRINISCGKICANAQISQENPKTAQAILDALPFEAPAHVWGDEVYFEVPVFVPLENGRSDLEVGELGYWPTGRMFCIFFGPTPISNNEKPKPASDVNIFAAVDGDSTIFRGIRAGDIVRVEKV